MDKIFARLTQDEEDVMRFAPAWISLLIAGADNHIEGKELKAAIYFISKLREKGDEEMEAFYTLLAEEFETNLNGYKALLPRDTQKRNLLLMEKLGKLNNIFKKIDKKFARQYYADMKELALTVAEASGGILSLSPVSDKEKQFLNLSMINKPE